MQPLPTPPQPNHLRLVFVGDTVGKPGIKVAALAVQWFNQELKADCLIVNAENAADGSGLRRSDYRALITAGYHGITLGDHIYKKQEVIEVLETADNLIRPCNLPKTAPGKTSMILNVRDVHQVAVISALGRVFMKPVDCPFTAVEEELAKIPDQVKIRVVDFHAEATSDKQIMGRFLDGRVSGVLGTHTHVTTADEQVLPGGTGFQCDIGMTGPFESIIGRNIDAVLESTLTARPVPFHVAKGDNRVSATWMDISCVDGKCIEIGRVCLKQKFLEDYQKDRSNSSD